MDGLAALALAERNAGPACDAGNRIPTSRYPVYSETLQGVIAIGQTEVTLTFEAERDTLFTDLSVEGTDDFASDGGYVDVTYCNVTYLKNSRSENWKTCCQRKPLFVVGVRDNKKLSFTVRLGTAAVAASTIFVTVSGFQGSGCCG